MSKQKRKAAAAREDFPQPLPELPPIARYYFSRDKVETATYALSDLLCWMDGFKAAGGVYSPDSLGVLRDLNANLKTINEIQNKNHVI